MKLWLARHARPLCADGRCYGAADFAADAGATEMAASALAATLPRGLSVASSPLRRCAQLAGALHALRPDLAWQPDPRLAEMDFGDWEGRSWDAIGAEAVAAWTADFAGHRCGGGESVAMLMARVAQALADARAGGRDALWITHAGVARAAGLLAAGVALPGTAAEWPRAGIAFGELACLSLA